MLIDTQAVLATFMLFCRIGACIALMPGFSSSRIPAHFRLLLAFAVTMSVAPLLTPAFGPELASPTPVRVVVLIAYETLVGVLIGLLGRLFFLALQFMASAVASMIGLSLPGGIQAEETEQDPSLASLIVMTATMLFFVTGQHGEVVRALASSYAVIAPGAPPEFAAGLGRLGDTLFEAFVLSLRVSSPFLLYAILIQLLFGITNRLVPQVPVYFVSAPFILAGGLLVLYSTMEDSLRVFMAGFSGWLQKG